MRGIKAIISMLLFGAGLLGAGYITPSLQAVLDTLSPGNKVRVYVHLIEKPNLSRFSQKAYKEKIAYLKEFALQKQTPLINFVNSFGNLVENVKSFWVFSGFSFRGTKNVMAAIAERPEVKFLSGGLTCGIEEPLGESKAPDYWNVPRVRAPDV
jgi:hypothetical protein